MKKSALSRYPKVLADELHAALSGVSELTPETKMEYLERYRSNHVKCIATWGLLNIGAPVSGLKHIPEKYFQKIARLDAAFQKLHDYRNGGAGDYAAADVEKAINSFRAKGPRKRDHNYGEICDWLRRRGYESSDNKKRLVLDAVDVFDVSESRVRRALQANGMTRKEPVRNFVCEAYHVIKEHVCQPRPARARRR